MWQQQTLEKFGKGVRWQQTLPHQVAGVLFSNELLDAMPVHRLRWNARTRSWGEWFVTVADNKLEWQAAALSPEVADHTPDVSDELANVLPDCFTVETSPSAVKWWSDASRVLQKGRIVAIDYGLTAEEFFRPDRSNGTARAYFKHRLANDLLANAGEKTSLRT